jgi:hypothetical protein
MSDKPPYGDGNDMYYQCADLVLSADAEPDEMPPVGAAAVVAEAATERVESRSCRTASPSRPATTCCSSASTGPTSATLSTGLGDKPPDIDQDVERPTVEGLDNAALEVL